MLSQILCCRCKGVIAGDAPGGFCRSCQEALAAGAETRDASEVASAATGSYLSPSVEPTAVQGTPPASAPGPLPPGPLPRLAGYELLGELGQGGMGVVYRARQVRADRIVALKVMKGGLGLLANDRERFRREALALGRVRHPHIVQIFEVGEEQNCPFFSMEFIEGGSLADRVARDGPLDPHAAAALMRTVAGAVEAAHQAGVIHRDLKPANILLERDDTPRVSDFGLAKRMDVDDGHTPTGAALGTPSFMAPEQASGRTGEVGATADVYGLGATLYLLLTGSPPFKGESQFETIRQVLDEEPLPPSRQRPGVPVQLEAVCLKCLEKDPSRRYPTAQAFADDLGRWLNGDRVSAPLPSLFRRLARRPWRWGALALFLGLLAAAVYSHGAYLSPERPDPVAELAAKLQSGEAVTLLGEAGWPDHFTVIAPGPKGNQPFLDPQGVFTIETRGLVLVELVPPPLCPAHGYHLKARVRYNEGSPLEGRSGIYGCRTDQVRGGVDNQFLAEFNFVDEVGDFAVAGKPPPGWQFGHYTFALRRYETGSERAKYYPAHSFATVNAFFLNPRLARHQTPAFRDLEMDVRPDGVTCFWQGKPAGTVSAATIVNDQKKVYRVDPVPIVLPSGGIGLQVYEGSVSFRSVTITPLPPR